LNSTKKQLKLNRQYKNERYPSIAVTVDLAELKPLLKQKLDELETLWGLEPGKLHQHLHRLGSQQAADFVQSHSGLLKQLSEANEKPADYLKSFNNFIPDQPKDKYSPLPLEKGD
jgi:hypothetical protein